ncbi:MAG TPA: hypothetical protein VLM38_14030 [Blastocatellia bacterium]|nr:hypothetical protein [Blastocatellia bacterium]
MMIRTKTLIVLGTLLTFAWAASVWAIPDERAAYPSGYRTWVHVRSALIDPKSATADRFGGIHHIYANEKAVEG